MFCLLLLGISSLQAMQVFVRITDETTITLEMEPADSVENLKQKIQDKLEILNLLVIPQDQQILLFAGNRLEDGFTLEDYSIHGGDTIELNNHYIISVTSGSGFNIKAGTVIGAEGLDLTPSSDFSLGTSLLLGEASNNSTTIVQICIFAYCCCYWR